MSDKLRFAPLVRVSTERQEEHRKESLREQKSQIEQAVKALNGVLIHDPWRYSGQEHATPGFEHKRVDQLLKDAQRGIFDAVIVVDPSRWSRDNLKSKQGIQIFKEHGIRFFTLQIEHDLFDPGAELFLGMATEFNEYAAKILAKKSLHSRIARASRSLPTAGKLPYGRVYDKKTETWGIDEEKREKIEWAAKEYLKGRQIKDLAKELGMNKSNLWKILTRRSGPTWEIEFKSKRIAIDQKATLKIPPLLDSETIRKIHAKAEANKTYTHGIIKHEYLLSRMVFCAKCGYAMFGQTNHNGRRYYRHIQKGLRERICDPKLWVRADELEKDVIVRLFATLGDGQGMEKAIQRAIPDRAKIGELREKKKFLQSELSKAEGQKNRLIKSIAKGIVSEEEAKAEITEIRERQSSINAKIESIEPQVVNVPDEEQIRRRAKMIQRMVSQIYRLPSRLKRMSFEERRQLVSSFFAGKDARGSRLGIYVSKAKSGEVEYEIRGMVQSFKGTLGDLDMLPYVNVEYLEELKEAVKQDMSDKCHAHHGFRLH
jgi:site-specific DNA recombinase